MFATSLVVGYFSSLVLAPHIGTVGAGFRAGFDPLDSLGVMGLLPMSLWPVPTLAAAGVILGLGHIRIRIDAEPDAGDDGKSAEQAPRR